MKYNHLSFLLVLNNLINDFLCGKYPNCFLDLESLKTIIEDFRDNFDKEFNPIYKDKE